MEGWDGDADVAESEELSIANMKRRRQCMIVVPQEVVIGEDGRRG